MGNDQPGGCRALSCAAEDDDFVMASSTDEFWGFGRFPPDGGKGNLVPVGAFRDATMADVKKLLSPELWKLLRPEVGFL
jgi:hypothetical protein